MVSGLVGGVFPLPLLRDLSSLGVAFAVCSVMVFIACSFRIVDTWVSVEQDGAGAPLTASGGCPVDCPVGPPDRGRCWLSFWRALAGNRRGDGGRRGGSRRMVGSSVTLCRWLDPAGSWTGDQTRA